MRLGWQCQTSHHLLDYNIVTCASEHIIIIYYDIVFTGTDHYITGAGLGGHAKGKTGIGLDEHCANSYIPQHI